MSIEELMHINPKHLTALRDLYAGFPFDDVEIVMQETALCDETEEARTLGFACALHKIKFDSVICGKNRSHALFVADEDDGFYYVSFAHVGQLEDRVIFKLIRKVVTP